MNRPYKVSNGMICGFCAVVLSAFFGVLYVVPVFSSALVKEEWIMVGLWTVLGIIFYTYSKIKYKAEFGEHK